MAETITNYNVQLHRKTASGWDNLYPKTKVSNITDLLSNSGKIKDDWLPSYVFGGQRYNCVLNKVGSYQTITADKLFSSSDYIGKFGAPLEPTDGTNAAYKGCYWIIGTLGSITLSPVTIPGDAAPKIFFILQSGTSDDNTVFPDIDDPTQGDPITLTLETGDWLIYDGCVTSSDNTRRHYFSIINNTYAEASTTTLGVVKKGDFGDNNTGVVTGSQVSAYITGLNLVDEDALNDYKSAINEEMRTFKSEVTDNMITQTTLNAYAQKTNVTANTEGLKIPKWNESGVITGEVTTLVNASNTASGFLTSTDYKTIQCIRASSSSAAAVTNATNGDIYFETVS